MFYFIPVEQHDLFKKIITFKAKSLKTTLPESCRLYACTLLSRYTKCITTTKDSFSLQVPGAMEVILFQGTTEPHSNCCNCEAQGQTPH